MARKKRTKIVNASKCSYKGIQFQSKLELFAYKSLKKDKLKVDYEKHTFTVLKGATYYNYSIEHPFQEVVSLLCGTEYNNDEKHFYIDYSKVESIISFLKSQEKDPA